MRSTSTFKAVVALTLGLVSISCLNGQEKKAVQTDEMEQLIAQREKELVESIYQMTQTARKPSDYTAIIEACQAGVKKKISEGKKKYLKSLEAWSFNRRGNARFDLSKDIRAIQNVEQADEILSQAEADYQEAISRDAKNWRPKLGMGMIQVERGELLTAIDTFTEVCDLNPEKSQGWFNRAECWYQMGKFQKAMEDYNQVLNLNSSDCLQVT